MKTEESHLTNLTKLYVLVLLRRAPMHGYELMRDFKKITGKSLSAGQIYPLLDGMRKKGLLAVAEEYEGQRKRKVYRLTENGEELHKELLSILSRLLNCDYNVLKNA